MLKVPKVRKHETATETGSPLPRHRSVSSSRLQGDNCMDQFKPVAFCWLRRESRPRVWFINLMCSPWFERISILVILINCVTLGMYDPFDTNCETQQCNVLETMETCIYVFFLVEMLVKWVAMGLFGKQGYFADSWNKLDCFIVAAGSFELAYGEGEFLSAVRSIRVLRPLRAINRVPSIRILVMLLLDTLPMLGNVLVICFLIFAIFGIIGVQLWQGLLHSRCYPDGLNRTIIAENNLSEFYRHSFDKPDYVCSLPGNSGLAKCNKQYFTRYTMNNIQCNMTLQSKLNSSSSSNTCVDWNQYYTTCRESGDNINYGLISFDNIGIATVAIFQIITFEGWTDIMYKVQDAHSFWNWLYFVVLILLGSYFMTNLCLVVITSQFQETKQREMELVKLSRLRSRASVSTVSSNFMQEGCYTQILRYLEHLARRLRRRVRVALKLEKPQNRKVNPCLQLKARRDNVTSVHHHHHHYHYYHHFVHHPLCQCPGIENYDSPPASAEPCAESSRIAQDNEDQGNPKEGKRILVVPQIQVVAQAATALYKDSDTDGPGEMVSTATANINVPGSGSTASMITYSQTADTVSLAAQATAQTLEAACSCAMQQKEETKLSEVAKEYYSFDSSDDEGRERNENRHITCAGKLKNVMMKFVESPRFTRFIMASIFLNTICMAVEHHGQPVKMTETLEILNIIFTSIFALEMLSKIIAFGPYGYIKDPYNLFDGVIVIVSVMDAFRGNDDGAGISILRSFRLLRILKLVRFMPALQRQLRVMVRTLDNVMTFLVLLSLFIFTASILGMHLFGAKYTFKNERGELEVARANFDTLFWALVTVFQVLTQEDWNVVLYDGMRATSSWAALYFIFLMTIGNYILFNLLVAILVEGFADQTENERSLLKPENTGRSGNCGKLRLQNDKNLTLSCPNINEKLKEESNKHRPITRCNSAPGLPGANSRKTQQSSSYPNMLNVGGLECKKREPAEETGTTYDKCRCSSTEEDTSLVLRNDIVSDNGDKNCTLRANRWSWFHRRSSWSLYLFSPNNSFRKLMVKIHSNVWFDRVILFFILFNCVVMAMEEPGLHRNSKKEFIDIMQYIFTAIFTFEMLIKIISLGLYFGPETYLRSGWNVVDGILVLFSLVDLTISLATRSHSGILGVLRVFRAFRTVRPLRVINRAPELKLVVETLLSSMKPIGNVVLIAATFFTIFGILGVQLFKGMFYSCKEVLPYVEIQNKSQCLSNSGKWMNDEYNFDNLPRALLTLFVFATRDGWVTIMYSGVDSVGVDQQPQRNHSKWNVLYFVVFLLLAGFVVLNMLVGVVVENFHKCRNELLREQKALKMEKKGLEESRESDSFESVDYESFSPLRQKLFHLVTHDYFDLAIAVVIGVNVLCMTIEHYNQPEELTLFLKYANYFFTIMFILEAALKIKALGAKTYFKTRWNCLDMLIVLLSIGGIILDELATSDFPINPTIIRVMRILRITRVLKLLKTADGIRSLLDTVGKALPQVANLGLLFLLLFFIFGALGMELFGDISCEVVECEGLDNHAHFKNFGYSCLTLFRVSTGDNWNGILKDTINKNRCTPDSKAGCKIIQKIAPVYFAIFVLIAQFVLLNVVVAVMMKHLEESKFTRKQEILVSTQERSPIHEIPKVFLETDASADTPNIQTPKETPRLRFSGTFPSFKILRFLTNDDGNSEKTDDVVLKTGNKITVDILVVDNEREKAVASLAGNNFYSGSDSDVTSSSTSSEESTTDNENNFQELGKFRETKVGVHGDKKGENVDKKDIGEHSCGKVVMGVDIGGERDNRKEFGNKFGNQEPVRSNITLVKPLEDEVCDDNPLKSAKDEDKEIEDEKGIEQEMVKDHEQELGRVHEKEKERIVGSGKERRKRLKEPELRHAVLEDPREIGGGRREVMRISRREREEQKTIDGHEMKGREGDRDKEREEKEKNGKKEEQETINKQRQQEKMRKEQRETDRQGQKESVTQEHQDLQGQMQDQSGQIEGQHGQKESVTQEHQDMQGQMQDQSGQIEGQHGQKESVTQEHQDMQGQMQDQWTEGQHGQKEEERHKEDQVQRAGVKKIQEVREPNEGRGDEGQQGINITQNRLKGENNNRETQGQEERQGEKRRAGNKEKEQKQELQERQGAEQNCENKQRDTLQETATKHNPKMKQREGFHGIRLEPLLNYQSKQS